MKSEQDDLIIEAFGQGFVLTKFKRQDIIKIMEEYKNA